MKTCRKCNELKSLDLFDKQPLYSSRDGRRSYCKACKKKYYNYPKRLEAYRIENPERARAKNLTRFWPGASWQESLVNYNSLLSLQKHTCAICKLPESIVEPRNGKVKNLAVDHCHVVGVVRGLLCDKCNRALGLLQDKVENCNSAAEYLKKHQKWLNGEEE